MTITIHTQFSFCAKHKILVPSTVYWDAMIKISMWHIPQSSGWQAFCPSGLTQHQWWERRKTAGGKRLNQSDLKKKKKDKNIWIIRLAAFILNTKAAKLFEIYHTMYDKNLKLNVNQQLWRRALSLKPCHSHTTNLALLLNWGSKYSQTRYTARPE